MRLSVELIQQANSNTNPIGEYELLLRSYNILYIENLGITLDYYNCIDLSHNNITKLNNIPTLYKLYTLLLSYNNINYIDYNIYQSLPNITTIVLTHNNIDNINILKPLQQCKSLTSLILFDNPICNITNYRLTIIALLPQLKLLDMNKIKPNERKQAKSIDIDMLLVQAAQQQQQQQTKKRTAIDDIQQQQKQIKKQKLIEQIKKTTKLSELTKLENELKMLEE